MSWKKTITTIPPETKSWRDTIQEDSDSISMGESAIRGGAQGISFGLADEITALLESVASNKPYEQAVEESRQAYKQAEEANPITYGGAELLSSLAIPVGGTAKAATGGLIPAMIKGGLIGGASGALTGFGAGEGQEASIEGLKQGAMTGVALGATIPGAIAGIKAAPGVAKKGLEWVGEQISNKDILAEAKRGFEKSRAGVDLGIKRVAPKFLDESKELVEEMQDALSGSHLKKDIVTDVAENLYPEDRLKALNLVEELKLKRDSLSSKDSQEKVNKIIDVIENAAGKQEEVKLRPSGPVVKGDIQKKAQTMIGKLSEEKAKLQSQVDELETMAINKFDELSPELSKQLENNINRLKNKITEIDDNVTKIKAEGTNQDTLTALLSKPKIDQDLNVIPGKSISKAIPEDIKGEYTPISLQSEKTFKTPNLSAKQSQELHQKINALDFGKDNEISPIIKDLLSSVKRGSTKGDKELLSLYDEANQQYGTVKDLLKDLGLSQSSEGIEKIEEAKKMANLFADSPELLQDLDSHTSRKIIKEITDKLEGIVPQEKIEALMSKLKETSENYLLSKRLYTTSMLGGGKDIIGKTFSAGPSGMVTGAVLLGKGARGLDKLSKSLESTKIPFKEWSNIVEKANKPEVANTLKSKGVNYLNDRISSTNGYAKTAAMFSALQNPEYRKQMGLTEEDND